MRRIRPKPTVHHGSETSFIRKNLEQATHVFVKDDSGPSSIQPAYQGPYEILAKINKRLYTILIKYKLSNIAVERLKPAFLTTTEKAGDLHHQKQLSRVQTKKSTIPNQTMI